MQTWATVAAKHATFTSAIGLGAIPATGWDSLDGFAAGMLLAGAGFAALNRSRRVRSYSIPPVTAGRGRPQASGPAVGRLTRVRQRVDGLLTGMLSDDAEPIPPVPLAALGEAGLAGRTLAVARSRESAQHGESEQGESEHGESEHGESGSEERADPGDRRSPDSAAAPPEPADRPDPDPADRPEPDSADRPGSDPAARPYDPPDRRDPDPAGWPYPATPESSSGSPARRAAVGRNSQLEPCGESNPADEPGSRETGSGRQTGETGREMPSRHGREQGSGREHEADESFWGPDEPAGQAQGGYQSKHRLDGPSRDAQPHDGRRAKPRHAAPPARFGVTLGRTLTGARLTSRSASHAGG